MFMSDSSTVAGRSQPGFLFQPREYLRDSCQQVQQRKVAEPVSVLSAVMPRDLNASHELANVYFGHGWFSGLGAVTAYFFAQNRNRKLEETMFPPVAGKCQP